MLPLLIRMPSRDVDELGKWTSWTIEKHTLYYIILKSSIPSTHFMAASRRIADAYCFQTCLTQGSNQPFAMKFRSYSDMHKLEPNGQTTNLTVKFLRPRSTTSAHFWSVGLIKTDKRSVLYLSDTIKWSLPAALRCRRFATGSLRGSTFCDDPSRASNRRSSRIGLQSPASWPARCTSWYADRLNTTVAIKSQTSTVTPHEY